MSHSHKYERLSDVAVFCQGCGDVKTAPQACSLPHYYPYWTAPRPYWQPVPSPYWIAPTIWSGTTSSGSIVTGGVTAQVSDNVTYTASPDDGSLS